MWSPLPSVRCLDSNSRLALSYSFGPRNKDTMSLGCVASVHPTLLTFIKYCSNTYMDIQVPHTGYTHRWCLTSGGSSYQEMPGASIWPAFTSTVTTHNVSLAWRSGNPLWWRCDTYSIELTRVDSQSQLLSTAAAVPFYTRPSLLAASPHVRSWPSLRWHTLWILDLDPWWH